MKKIIVSILATICLTACVHEKIETPTGGPEITFGTSLTAYATKSGGVVLDDSNFKEFFVWGWATNRAGVTTPVFEGTKVTKDQNGNWTYDESNGKRYWVPNCTYTFRAVAPHLPVEFQQQYDGQQNKLIYDENGLPKYYFGVWGNNGISDYCFDTYIHQPSVSGYGPVEFEFQHLLSKLIISIKNNVDPYINIGISNIEIGAPTQGSIMDLDNIVWTGINDTGSYLFDPIAQIEPYEDGETGPLFVIPTSADYEHPVSFDVTLTMDGVTPNLRTKTITGKISNKAFEMGSAYKLTAVIDANSIDSGYTTFEVTQIPYWQVAEGESEVFSSQEKILIASKLGGEVILKGPASFSNCVEVVDDLTISSAASGSYALTFNGDNTLEDCLFYVSSKVSDDPADTRTYPTNNSDNIATLTIDGTPGDISLVSTTNSYLGVAGPNGKIVINGGYHETAGLTAYKSIGGAVTITDGKFKSTSNLTSYVLLEGSNENISVSGGSFYKWDPSNGDTDFDDEKNYLTRPLSGSNEKLIVKYKDEYYMVRKDITITGNKDEASQDFVDIIQNKVEDGDVINLGANISVSNVYDFQLQNTGDVTINMGGNTLEGDVNIGYAGLIGSNTHVTFNNGTITGGGLNVQGTGSKVTLNNCNINITTSNTSARYCIYAGPNAEITINGGNLDFNPKNKKRAYFYANTNAIIYVNDCVCSTPSTYRNNNDTNPIYYQENPIIEGGGQVIIRGGTFGFDPSTWVDEGYYPWENSNGTYTVYKDGTGPKYEQNIS